MYMHMYMYTRDEGGRGPAGGWQGDGRGGDDRECWVCVAQCGPSVATVVGAAVGRCKGSSQVSLSLPLLCMYVSYVTCVYM